MFKFVCITFLSITSAAQLNGFTLRSAKASDPAYEIAYDTPRVSSCDVVAKSNGSKTIMATISVSIRLSGNLSTPEHVDIEFESPGKELRLLDFLPKTTTSTDILGPVFVEESTEASGNVNIKFSSGTPGLASSAASASVGGSHKTKLSYQQLPPRNVILASGTTKRGDGVFFKLKPTSQNPIEGQHKFTCLFDVSPEWKYGFIDATFSPRNSWDTKKAFVIGIHLDGDKDAESCAGQLACGVEKYRTEVMPVMEQIKTIQNYKAFPLLGYGTQAAKLEESIVTSKQQYEQMILKMEEANSKRR